MKRTREMTLIAGLALAVTTVAGFGGAASATGADGAPLQLWTCLGEGQTNQHFRFVSP